MCYYKIAPLTQLHSLTTIKNLISFVKSNDSFMEEFNELYLIY